MEECFLFKSIIKRCLTSLADLQDLWADKIVAVFKGTSDVGTIENCWNLLENWSSFVVVLWLEVTSDLPTRTGERPDRCVHYPPPSTIDSLVCEGKGEVVKKGGTKNLGWMSALIHSSCQTHNHNLMIKSFSIWDICYILDPDRTATQ